MSPPRNRGNAPVSGEHRMTEPQRTHTHTQRHAHASRDSKEPRP
jgi:hypothetical protein